MAQNATYHVGFDWTLLTNSDVVTATFQNQSGYEVYVTATAGTGAPSADAPYIVYARFQGERSTSLSDLFPGVSGANRLWARISDGTARIFISHA